MTHTISFMSANYVAREVGYNMTRGWGQGDAAANDHFQPLDTFAERFEEILRDVQGLGFKAIDLWTSHLNPTWATPEHISIARDLLDRYDLKVPSLGGWFGSSHEAFEATCKLAAALDVKILGGSSSMLEQDRDFVIGMLHRYELRLGLENHPEKTPEEMLAKIGDGGEGTLGTTVDTGWYGTQGYNAAQAIKALGEHVVYVHLKDVLAAGEHRTCRYGEGVVPIRDCVFMLEQIGYENALCVEHEPETFDPGEDCRANLHMLREWLHERA